MRGTRLATYSISYLRKHPLQHLLLHSFEVSHLHLLDSLEQLHDLCFRFLHHCRFQGFIRFHFQGTALHFFDFS